MTSLDCRRHAFVRGGSGSLAIGRGGARECTFAQDDRLVRVAPLLAMVPDWNAFLNSAMPEEELGQLRRHVRTGRPLGDETFVGRLEEMVGRALKPQKRGPKPKHRANQVYVPGIRFQSWGRTLQRKSVSRGRFVFSLTGSEHGNQPAAEFTEYRTFLLIQ